MDSVAEAFFLRRSTVEAHEIQSMPSPPSAVMLGNGQTSATRDHASIGDFPAIVCSDKDLKEDLI